MAVSLDTRAHRIKQLSQMSLNHLRMSGVDGDGLQALDGQLQRVVAVIDAYETAAAGVRNDTGLTPAGREPRLKALQAQALKDLAEVTGQPLAGYARHLSDLQGKYVERAREISDTERLRQEIRASEIRRHFDTLTGYDRQAWYERASPEQQQAIEGAPVELIAVEVRQQVQAQRLQRLHPELSAEISHLEALSGAFSEVVASAEAHLGVERPSPITFGPNSQPLG